MSCKFANKNMFGTVTCEIDNEECFFNQPDSKRCAQMYNRGPESNKDERESMEEIIDRIIDEEGDFESEEDEIDNIADGNF